MEDSEKAEKADLVNRGGKIQWPRFCDRDHEALRGRWHHYYVGDERHQQ